jgi:hypothetical protein
MGQKVVLSPLKIKDVFLQCVRMGIHCLHAQLMVIVTSFLVKSLNSYLIMICRMTSDPLYKYRFVVENSLNVCYNSCLVRCYCTMKKYIVIGTEEGCIFVYEINQKQLVRK